MDGSRPVRLCDVAHARSGDKGSHANIGVIAYTAAGWEWLGSVLTETRVAGFFLSLRPRRVVRYPMPGIQAWNFLLENVLAGGASGSLRTDSQGKTLALALLQMELPPPPGPEVFRPTAAKTAPHDPAVEGTTASSSTSSSSSFPSAANESSP